MKYSDINIFCCPKCRGGLRFAKINGFDKDSDASRVLVQEEGAREVWEGLVVCADCHCQYPILESIPRFVKSNTYAASFGY